MNRVNTYIRYILQNKSKKIIPCKREYCYCIDNINISNPKEYDFYKQCYQSWYEFYKQ